MKKTIYTLLIVIMTISNVACGLISINESGYKSLSKENKARIVRCDRPIDSLTYNSRIYQIDTEQMRQYLNRHGDVIIYGYASFCHSENCINPRMAEKLCKENDFGFCLIIETYDYLERIPNMEVPILSIYQERYHTDKTPKYCEMFYKDLTGTTYEERGYGRFYHFKYGKFIKAYDNINDVFKPN